MGKLGSNIFETIVVQTLDEFAITVEFDARLLSAEKISSVAVVIFDKTNAVVTGTILNGSATIQNGVSTNSEILFNVHALVDGERYNAQVLVTTDAAIPQKLEADIFIPVKKLTTVVAA